MVFLENFYSVLLLAHLFATFVLVGSMTHNLLCVFDYLRGKFGRQKLEWLYVKVSLWSYVVVYIIGALIYPAYRIHIRQEYFDPSYHGLRGSLRSRSTGGLWVWTCFLCIIFCVEVSSLPKKRENCSSTYPYASY